MVFSSMCYIGYLTWSAWDLSIVTAYVFTFLCGQEELSKEDLSPWLDKCIFCIYKSKSRVSPLPCIHCADNQLNCGANASERRLYFAGTVLTLKGAVLTFACLDCTGTLIHPPYEVWRDPHSADDGEKTRKRKLVMHSPSSSQDMGDHQFAVICSEKQAKVFSLPSQTCLYVHNITETSFLLQADVVTLCNSVCLACFCANGHIMTLRYLSN